MGHADVRGVLRRDGELPLDEMLPGATSDVSRSTPCRPSAWTGASEDEERGVPAGGLRRRHPRGRSRSWPALGNGAEKPAGRLPHATHEVQNLADSNDGCFHENGKVVLARQAAAELNGQRGAICASTQTAFRIEILNALTGDRMGTDVIRATESPFRLDSAVGTAIELAFGMLILTRPAASGAAASGAAASGDAAKGAAASGAAEGTRSLQGLVVTADPGTVVQLFVVKRTPPFINEIADRESSLGVRKWRTEFRSLVGAGGWRAPSP